MSYSFTVKAMSKDDVKRELEVKFDEVIATQPVHAADKAQALAAAGAFIDLLKDVPEGHHVQVSLHGSLGWDGVDQKVFNGAGVGVSASIMLNQAV